MLLFIFARLTNESQEVIEFGTSPIIRDWIVKKAELLLV